jgi:predicted ATPase
LITKVEALNYRSLRNVQQELGPFHVLVGANASGKTTFLDVISFLSDLIVKGPAEAISKRSRNFQDLVWGRTGDSFQLAIEAEIPEHRRVPVGFSVLRYEVELGYDAKRNELGIWAELIRWVGSESAPSQSSNESQNLLGSTNPADPQLLLSKGRDGSALYFEERPPHMSFLFQVGARRCGLVNLPEDSTRFPALTWFKQLLADGVKSLSLDSHAMRRASAPGQSRGFQSDGSNLPWVVEELREKHPEQFQDWIDHLRTVLPDLVGVRVVDREDDRHRYLMIQYRGGLEVPSWMTSDGTLRLMALTLLAYLPERDVIYLIEEPENGIHPRGIEAIYQSLSNVYDSQVLLATHSSLILSLVEAEQLLCFSKDQDGATEIVRGPDHPNLKGWKGETNLAALFAAGVLG